ncbi:MAG: polyprenyl diphosphate synthase [bacterium]
MGARHVAIIMDGNGRWAKQRGLDRTAGHKEGAKAVRRIVRHAREQGLEWLTLFAFSSLNWARPPYEVRELMDLLVQFLADEEPELLENGIRLTAIGERAYLPRYVREALERVERSTAHCQAMRLVLAVSYDGRRDVVQAVRRLVHMAARGELLAADVGEAHLMAALSTADMPDVDLLIRTSGERRLSGFLPIEACYAELIFTEGLWPDFQTSDFDAAMDEYNHRERRFGQTSAQLEAAPAFGR